MCRLCRIKGIAGEKGTRCESVTIPVAVCIRKKKTPSAKAGHWETEKAGDFFAAACFAIGCKVKRPALMLFRTYCRRVSRPAGRKPSFFACFAEKVLSASCNFFELCKGFVVMPICKRHRNSCCGGFCLLAAAAFLYAAQIKSLHSNN